MSSHVVIRSVGLATVRGGRVASLTALARPFDERPSNGGWRCPLIPSDCTGGDRWNQLARLAIAECCGTTSTDRVPLVIGTSNGAATNYEASSWRSAFDAAQLLTDTPWARERVPVVSGSCASGMQALFLGAQLVRSGGATDVVVLAADILSPASQTNFASLRMLADDVRTPWQADSDGFVTGEAAVALWLSAAEPDDPRPRLRGPVLSQDLSTANGLARCLSALSEATPALLIGQGTGPVEVDGVELAAFAATVDYHVPVMALWPQFGHTLGASGPLSIAVATLLKAGGLSPAGRTRDGRPPVDGRVVASGMAALPARIACRALIGACAAAEVDDSDALQSHARSEFEPSAPPVAVMHPALQRIAQEATRYRPVVPPDLLLVHLEAPLLPPERARIGGRLLPTAIYEITPGYVAQLIARQWGFTGGAMTIVGSNAITDSPWVQACRECGLTVQQVRIRDANEHLQIDWNA